MSLIMLFYYFEQHLYFDQTAQESNCTVLTVFSLFIPLNANEIQYLFLLFAYFTKNEIVD